MSENTHGAQWYHMIFYPAFLKGLIITRILKGNEL